MALAHIPSMEKWLITSLMSLAGSDQEALVSDIISNALKEGIIKEVIRTPWSEGDPGYITIVTDHIVITLEDTNGTDRTEGN